MCGRHRQDTARLRRRTGAVYSMFYDGDSISSIDAIPSLAHGNVLISMPIYREMEPQTTTCCRTRYVWACGSLDYIEVTKVHILVLVLQSFKIAEDRKSTVKESQWHIPIVIPEPLTPTGVIQKRVGLKTLFKFKSWESNKWLTYLSKKYDRRPRWPIIPNRGIVSYGDGDDAEHQ